MGKDREDRRRAAAKTKRQARRQDERPESAGGGQPRRLMRPTGDRGETENAQDRSMEQRTVNSPGAERTPASLRDNGDVEEQESFEHSSRAASVNSGRVAADDQDPMPERYQ